MGARGIKHNVKWLQQDHPLTNQGNYQFLLCLYAADTLLQAKKISLMVSIAYDVFFNPLHTSFVFLV